MFIPLIVSLKTERETERGIERETERGIERERQREG